MPITSSENWYTYLKYYSELKVLMNLQWWHNTNELTLWWHSKSHNVAYQSCISFFTKYRYLPYHHISPKTWTCFITFPNLYFFHTMHHTSINIVTLYFHGDLPCIFLFLKILTTVYTPFLPCPRYLIFTHQCLCHENLEYLNFGCCYNQF